MTDDETMRPESIVHHIFTRADWNDALEEGWLTRQHVEDRLSRVVTHELGDGEEPFDSEGFFVSLTAESIQISDNVKIRVCSKDHDPPHVHIERRGKESFRLHLSTAEPYGNIPGDVKSKQLYAVQAAVLEFAQQLTAWWKATKAASVVNFRQS